MISTSQFNAEAVSALAGALSPHLQSQHSNLEHQTQ